MANREFRIAAAFQKIDWVSIFIVSLLPILLNAPSLFGRRSTNPLFVLSGLAFDYQPQIIPGYPWIDPSVGSYSQSLGHLSAEEWLHGRVPWWNHFTGVGMPLAAEMCSESFFLPFVLLYHFSNGWIIHEVVLEILAGLGAYACFRKFGLDGFPSLVGAALFASCGVFAWHGNPVTGPVPFLAWLIYGIESARSRALSKLNGGWIFISLSVAFSIYGGFPETAYINGLFAGVWSMSRCFPGTTSFRFRFAKKLLAGVGGGVLLSMPILIPFLEFVKLSYVGNHSFGRVGYGALHPEAFPISLFPWLYGGIFAFQDAKGLVSSIWSAVGGYLSFVQVGMILLALFIGRRKYLYFLLTGWIVVCFARTFGISIISPLVDAIPLIKLAAFFRYAPASWEFCSAMICASILNEMQSRDFRADRKVAAAITIGLVSVIALYPATTLYNELAYKPLYKEFFWISIIWGFGLLLAILILLWCLDAVRDSKHRVIFSRAIGALLIIDSATLFIVPTFSGIVVKNRSSGHQLDFLQNKLGLNRFYTLGPIGPNYGAYFQLASINHNYIPVSQRWLKYVLDHLDPYANAICFVPGFPRQDPHAPTQAEVLRERFHEYEEVGVRYVLTSHGAGLESLNSLDFVGDSAIWSATLKPVLTKGSSGAMPQEDARYLTFSDGTSQNERFSRVYESKGMDIYELYNPKPYFEVINGAGKLEAKDRSKAFLDFPVDSQLVRRELFYPGWKATIDGKGIPIECYNELFQTVKVPAGRHEIRFLYRPTYFGIMITSLLVGFGCITFSLGSRYLKRDQK